MKVSVLGKIVPIAHRQAPVVVFCPHVIHRAYQPPSPMDSGQGFWRRCESLGLCGMHRCSAVMWEEKGSIEVEHPLRQKTLFFSKCEFE